MRKFNPEKELNKIQNGNRNKVILFVISLLVVGVIGYSFALYQVRYSKRIIYTKVAPFSTHDLDLAISVDGNKLDTMPIKGTVYYNGITCDSDSTATANWDYDRWRLTSIDTSLPNKCNINFTKQKPLLTEKIKSIKATTESNIVDDETKDHNLRFIGKDPDNYIWFNCDSYDDLTQATAATKCEKWRIIGLMNNMTKIDENDNETSGQSLVKIIRANSIGNIAWDSANKNNWYTASLQILLNGDYLNSIGNYTSNKSPKGITNSTRNMIEKIKWNIGGGSAANLLISQWYEYERGELTYNSQPSIWNGYIGLMYPSDYGYATTGSNSGMNRNTCLTTVNLQSYNSGCKDKDWLFEANNQYTLTSNASVDNIVFYVYMDGASGYRYTQEPIAVQPSLYLKSNVKIVSGDGSSTPNGENGPYIIA